MFRINQGRCYQYKHESAFSAAWRLMSANQSIPWYVLKKELATTLSVTSDVDETLRASYEASRPKSVTRLETEHPQQVCLICLKYHYHSVLFDLPWINKCPIHQEVLLTNCPDCGKRWPTCVEYRKRACATCSQLAMPDWLKKRHNYPFRLETTNVERLWKILMLPSAHCKLRNQHPDQIYWNTYSFSDLSSFDFARFLKQYYTQMGKHEAAQILDQSAVPLKSPYVISGELTPTSFEDKFDTTPSHHHLLLNVRFNVLGYIVKFIQSLSPKTHNIFINRPDTHMCIADQERLCPLCLALNLWLRQVIGYPHLQPLLYVHKDYQVLRNIDFNYIKPFALTHFEQKDRRLFLTDDHIVGWSYERSLLYCFVQLLVAVCTILKSPGLRTWGPSFAHDELNRNLRALGKNYPKPFFFRYQSQLVIYNCLKSPLDLFDTRFLPETTGHKSNCNQQTDKHFDDDLADETQRSVVINSCKNLKAYEDLYAQEFYPGSSLEPKRDILKEIEDWYLAYEERYQENQQLFSQFEFSFD